MGAWEQARGPGHPARYRAGCGSPRRGCWPGLRLRSGCRALDDGHAGPGHAGCAVGRRPQRCPVPGCRTSGPRWTGHGGPLLADARDAAPAGSGGPALDAGHHGGPPASAAWRGRHRELDIDARRRRDSAGTSALEPWSRAADRPRAQQLFAAFEAAGQSTAGQRGIHMLGTLCQRAWLVQGPLGGEPAALRRSTSGSRSPGNWSGGGHRRAAAALHAGATARPRIRDFAWWTQIPLTDGGPQRPGTGAGPAGRAGVRRGQLLDVAGDRGTARRRRARPARRCCAARVRRVPAGLHGPEPGAARRSTPTRWFPAATGCSRRPSCPAAR